MAILEKYEQQPGELLDRDIDFATLFLSPLGDTAASVEVFADPGITLDDFFMSQGIVKVWLTGGVSGTTYKVTARVTSTAGRVKEAEIAIKVKES